MSTPSFSTKNTPSPHPLRTVTKVSWLLLGALFIFSGLIKLNDPVGTAYKLEEYFEVFAADLPLKKRNRELRAGRSAANTSKYSSSL